MTASEVRDHWADTEAEWSHGGAWLTSLVLPPKFVCDAVASAVGHMDMPFLVAVPAAGMHITVQGLSRLPAPIEERLPPLLDAVERELADVDTFDATLAKPVVGYGGVFCDALPEQRFEAIRDATRRGLDRLVAVPEAGGYWPHLAVAYATGQGPIDSVRRSWFRSVAGLSRRVSTVAFVQLRRSPRRYLWDVLAEVPIGRLGH
jgi:2'-5' RNA ligase